MTLNTFRSSVRPVVTYLFAIALVLGFVLGRISADTFTTLAGSVVVYWFGQRSSDSKKGTE